MINFIKKMALYNKYNKEELKRKLHEETFRRITLSFYRYVIIEDPAGYRDRLYRVWSELLVFGRIYVAGEGINAQLSVPEHNWEAFRSLIDEDPRLSGIRLNIAVEDDGKSFYKLIVKVRNKIVADGLDDNSFDVTDVGRHLDAKEFNEAISDPDTILVDMRNHYESEVGHFEGAICPVADTFREELPMVLDMLGDKKDKKLVLYCTGGIRCEKASAYFKHHGFKDVNQLQGGIIHYARQVKEQGLESRFRGKNFVFDDRMGERIGGEIVSQCHQCGSPSDNHVNCANDDCHLLFIQCSDCAREYEGCCTVKCREIIHLPEEEQRRLRKGKKKEDCLAVYKSRLRPNLRELRVRDQLL
jgi:UPF0176 protein